MSKIFTIAWKELKSYFVLPSFYAIALIFIVFSGMFFFNHLAVFYLSKLQPVPWESIEGRRDLNSMLIQPFFHSLSIIYLLIPVITMKLFAEEKRQRTDELLYSCPVSIGQIVLGKYLASVVLLCLLLMLTATHPLFVWIYGNPDPGPIVTGYLGLLLVGFAYLSVGIFCSSLTDNQIIAAIVAFGIISFFWMIGAVPYVINNTGLADFLSYFSMQEHFHVFTKGLIEIRDVTYFLTFTLFGLFLTYQVLDSRRWN